MQITKAHNVYTLTLIFFLLIHFSLSSASDGYLQFEKEKIRIRIGDDEYFLQGDYYIKNPARKICKRKIFYPIKTSANLPFPHFFQVTNLTDNHSVSFKKTKQGITFDVEIPPYWEQVYRVEYRQKTPGKRLEYILTTTSFWGKPLKTADFLIELPGKFKLIFLSLPYTIVKKNANFQVYHIHQENFAPTQNLIIKWRCSNDKKHN